MMSRGDKLAYWLILMSFLVWGSMWQQVMAYDATTPRTIQRLIDSMPCPPSSGGDFKCPSLNPNVTFYAVGEKGHFSQIGVHLFTDAIKNNTDVTVCECVERLMLEMLIQNDEKAAKQVLENHSVELIVNGQSFGEGRFVTLNNVLSMLRRSSKVSINSTPQSIRVEDHTLSGDVLTFTMPADRSLIFGTDKGEQEQIMLKEMADNVHPFHQTSLKGLSLKEIENGLYVYGSDEYMIHSLSNGIYMKKVGADYVPLFSPLEPYRSVQNLLMGVAPMEDVNRFSLNVGCHVYGGNKERVSISLSLFLGYMQSQGLQFYCSPYDSYTGTHKCLLFMLHPIYGYAHMLVVDLPEFGLLFDDLCICLDAELYTFIPQHNIDQLFN